MSKSISLKQDRVFRFTLHVLMAMALLSTNLKGVYTKPVTSQIAAMRDNEHELMMPADEKDKIYDLHYSWGNQLFVIEEDFNSDMMPYAVFLLKPALVHKIMVDELDDNV